MVSKFILISILLVSILTITLPVFATDSASHIETSGTAGSVISSGVSEVEVSVGGTYNSISSSRRMLTLGNTQFSTNQNSSSKYHNTLDSSDEVEFADAAIISDSYAMADAKNPAGKYAYLADDPTSSEQKVNVEFVQMGSNGGKYKSAGVVDNTDITTSMRAEGNAGSVTTKYASTTTSSLIAGSKTPNYQKREYGSVTRLNKNDTGYDAAFDWVWEDFSVPFEIINNTTSANVTNESVNITPAY